MATRLVVNGECIEYDDFCIGRDGMAETDWSDRAKRLLRGEMTRRGVSYKDLAARMPGESEANLRNKVSRGSFTAAFLLAAMSAIDCQTLRLNDD